jgi:hypothetical protein
MEGPDPALIAAANDDAGIVRDEDVESDDLGRLVRDLLGNLEIYHGQDLLADPYCTYSTKLLLQTSKLLYVSTDEQDNICS